MSPGECYRILDLEPGSSLQDVKKAYRQLAKVWHPDRFSQDPKMAQKATEKLKEINSAYELLRVHLENDREEYQTWRQRPSRTESTTRESAPPSPRPKTKREDIVIEAEDLTKVYTTGTDGNGKLYVLRGVSLRIGRGSVVAVVGASGAGKSTLLHILGTLDRPSSGKVAYDGVDVFSLTDDALARFRNEEIGFVFQFHHLLPEFTAVENVYMPSLIAGNPIREVAERAMSLLAEVGVSERAQERPPRLSGGERQRVALARALMNSPKVVLADEPTGNLDSANAQSLHDLIWSLSEKHKQTFIVVTHNESLAKQADKVIRLVDGVAQGGQ